MKKILTLSILCAAGLVLSCLDADAKTKSGADAKASYRYDVEYVESAGTGMSNVRTWSYSKSKNESENMVRRNAVHAVIFKGYAGAGATQPPLAKNPDVEANNAEFFNNFFAEGGEYARFATNLLDFQVVKSNKEYKYGATVTVNVAALRKYLEAKGIIRSLSSGF